MKLRTLFLRVACCIVEAATESKNTTLNLILVHLRLKHFSVSVLKRSRLPPVRPNSNETLGQHGHDIAVFQVSPAFSFNDRVAPTNLAPCDFHVRRDKEGMPAAVQLSILSLLVKAVCNIFRNGHRCGLGIRQERELQSPTGITPPGG